MKTDASLFARIALLLLGVFAGALSVVFIRFSSLHPVALASFRQIAAGIILLPVYIKQARKAGYQFSFPLIRPSILPGLLLGLHFIFWNYGVQYTTAANATLLVNMIPIIMPFFAFFLFREVINIPELLGTLLAISGIVLIGITDFQVSRESFLGDLSCFAAAVLMAAYLALSRRNNRGESIWIYMVPLYWIGGIFTFIISFFFTVPWAGMSWKNLLMVMGLACVSTITGHTIINFSMRRLRSQLVTLVNLVQIVYGAILGFIFFAEVPDIYFIISFPIIVTGAAVTILFSKRGEATLDDVGPRK